MTPGEWIALSVAVGSLLGTIWGGSRFVRGIEARQDQADSRMDAHEMLCGERYARIEQGQRAHIEVSNERHVENRERLENIDSKIDQLLSARAWPRGN